MAQILPSTFVMGTIAPVGCPMVGLEVVPRTRVLVDQRRFRSPARLLCSASALPLLGCPGAEKRCDPTVDSLRPRLERGFFCLSNNIWPRQSWCSTICVFCSRSILASRRITARLPPLQAVLAALVLPSAVFWRQAIRNDPGFPRLPEPTLPAPNRPLVLLRLDRQAWKQRISMIRRGRGTNSGSVSAFTDSGRSIRLKESNLSGR